MKKIFTLTLISLSSFSYAQQIDTLYVNDDKFINLQFTSGVSITQSSQPTFFFIESKGTVLFIQALQKDVVESNLFVQTADGKNHNYIVKYTPKLQRIVYDYSNVENIIKTDFQNTNIIDFVSNPLNGEKGYINTRNRVSKGKVTLYLKGVYSMADKLFILLNIVNNSNLNYDVADIKLFIRPSKQMKNIATQDEEIIPKIYNNIPSFIPSSNNYITLEISKNALIDKVISIDLLEKNGDRNLTIDIEDEYITNSKILNK